MRNVLRNVGWGILVWLVPFVVAVFVFPLRESWRALFESIMAVAVCTAAAVFGLLALRRRTMRGAGSGLAVGTIWWLVCVAIDLPMVAYGPMKMGLADYFADIGLTYVAIPVITTALAAAAATAAPAPRSAS